MGGGHMKTLTIGIAGGTGSGKTTITRNIVEAFGSEVSVLHHDSYYKSHDDLTYEERTKLNYDHPNSFDNDLFIEHIRALKNGESIDSPVYDYTVHNRSKETERIEPARVLVVEGILIYAEQAICDELDIKIFVDTDADVRILRRIMRDVKKRGRTLESVVDQYLTTVKPMHEQFVEPSKRRADIIVPEGGRNVVAIEMVMERIRGYLRSTEE